MISHHYFVAQIDAIRSHSKQRPIPVNLLILDGLICLPEFHNFALPIITGCAVRAQECRYLMRRLELKQYIEYPRE